MRMIDAGALIEIIRTHRLDLWEDVWSFFDGKPHRSRDYLRGLENGYWEVKKDIEQLPTIDAVEVVRCKDCRFYTEEERWCRRLWLCGAFDPNGYCSHAERREE